MTPEDARRFQDEWMAARPKWGDQDENGIDRSMIRQNLRMTMTERFEQYRRAAEFVVEVRNAGKRAGLQDPA